MKRILRHQVVNFTIVSGTASTSERITLLKGTAIRACVEVDGTLPNQLINLSLKDSGGDRLEDPTSIRNWEQRSGGSYEDSMKPIDIKGGQNIIVDLNASANLGADLAGQVIILIEDFCN